MSTVPWQLLSTVGDITMHMVDISTMEGVQYHGGSQITKDFPPQY